MDADATSRVRNLDTEWELSPVVFQKILKVLGLPSIDLFASRINRKCVRFCSRYPDPDAESVDAFTVSWSKEYFYAFPSFALVLPTLRKIINDEAVGIVVAPLWKAQPWYPLFTSLLSEPPLIFKPSLSLLLSPSRQELHPLATKLSLVVGKLSGRPSSSKASRKNQ